jgi:hypothetical protein
MIEHATQPNREAILTNARNGLLDRIADARDRLNRSTYGSVLRDGANRELADCQQQLAVVERCIARKSGIEQRRESAATFAHGLPSTPTPTAEVRSFITTADRTAAQALEMDTAVQMARRTVAGRTRTGAAGVVTRAPYVSKKKARKRAAKLARKMDKAWDPSHDPDWD